MSCLHLLLQVDQLASRMVGIRIEDQEVERGNKAREEIIKVSDRVRRQGLSRSSHRISGCFFSCLDAGICRSLVYPEERSSAVLFEVVTDFFPSDVATESSNTLMYSFS